MEFLLLFTIMMLFVKISIIDWQEHAIYDKDIFVTSIFILLYKGLYGNLLYALTGGLTALLLGFLIFVVVYKFYGFEAFGQGDVLLLVILGLFLEDSFLNYFALATMINGIVVPCSMIFFKQRFNASIEIAYAPIILAWIPLYYHLGFPSTLDLYDGVFKLLF